MKTENKDYNRGMKSKTIVSILTKKIKAWTDSIDDPHVRSLVEKNTIVTGGSIASMLLGEEINDFDIYFKNYETTIAVTKYYVQKFEQNRKPRPGIIIPKVEINEWTDALNNKRIEIFVKSAGIESVTADETSEPYNYFESQPDHDAGRYIDDVFDVAKEASGVTESDVSINPFNEIKEYDPVFLSTNAISLKGKIQLITRFYGEPSEIHKNYDFVHCTNYWESDTKKLTLHQQALESLLSKTLVYQGSLYPLCSVFRIRKFVERGWNINVGQILKMALQISKMDLTNHEVLKDQLTGVDVAYFTEIIRKLEDKNPEKVDTAYLVEIIDRMF